MKHHVGGRIRSTHSRGALPHVERYLQSGMLLDAAPPARDYAGEAMFSTYGNNVAGDCTIASLYHRRELLAKLHREPFSATTDQAFGDYSAVTGFDGRPGDATDHGAQMIDVLVHAKTVGIAGQRVAGYARVDPRNRPLMEQLLNAFVTIYVGANLPKAVDHQGFDWDMPPIEHRSEDDEPDEDRGHAFLLVGYDRLGWRVLTWGSSRYRASNAWAELCLDEAWVVIDDALVTGARPAPNGLDIDRLRADLEAA